MGLLTWIGLSGNSKNNSTNNINYKNYTGNNINSSPYSLKFSEINDKGENNEQGDDSSSIVDSSSSSNSSSVAKAKNTESKNDIEDKKNIIVDTSRNNLVDKNYVNLKRGNDGDINEGKGNGEIIDKRAYNKSGIHSGRAIAPTTAVTTNRHKMIGSHTVLNLPHFSFLKDDEIDSINPITGRSIYFGIMPWRCSDRVSDWLLSVTALDPPSVHYRHYKLLRACKNSLIGEEPVDNYHRLQRGSVIFYKDRSISNMLRPRFWQQFPYQTEDVLRIYEEDGLKMRVWRHQRRIEKEMESSATTKLENDISDNIISTLSKKKT